MPFRGLPALRAWRAYRPFRPSRAFPLLFAGALALGMLPTAAQTPFGINGRLKVCGTKLCNQHGHPIQLRGMSTHGLQWFPWGDCLKDASLESLARDWGADILRVSVYIQEGGWATDKAKFNGMVDQIIGAASARGLYVLLDFHLLTPGDPNANLDHAKEFFERMVPLHGPRGNVLFEIANEPNGVDWARIKQYADQIVPVIRKHDKQSPILVGTMAWSSLGVSGQGPWTHIASAPIADPNLLYVMHFYAGEHKDAYRAALRAASEKLPLFVTEFGTQAASGDGGNDFASGQAWLDLMAEKKISWVNWNFSDDFRSGAVLKEGTCPNGPWTGDRLKEAGAWVQARMKTQDDFPTQASASREVGRPDAPALASRLRAAAFADGIRLGVDLDGAYTVEIRDAAGKLAASFRGEGPRRFLLPREALAPGVHAVELRQGASAAARVLAVF